MRHTTVFHCGFPKQFCFLSFFLFLFISSFLSCKKRIRQKVFAWSWYIIYFENNPTRSYFQCTETVGRVYVLFCIQVGLYTRFCTISIHLKSYIRLGLSPHFLPDNVFFYLVHIDRGSQIWLSEQFYNHLQWFLILWAK